MQSFPKMLRSAGFIFWSSMAAQPSRWISLQGFLLGQQLETPNSEPILDFRISSFSFRREYFQFVLKTFQLFSRLSDDTLLLDGWFSDHFPGDSPKWSRNDTSRDAECCDNFFYTSALLPLGQLPKRWRSDFVAVVVRIMFTSGTCGQERFIEDVMKPRVVSTYLVSSLNPNGHIIRNGQMSRQDCSAELLKHRLRCMFLMHIQAYSCTHYIDAIWSSSVLRIQTRQLEPPKHKRFLVVKPCMTVVST